MIHRDVSVLILVDGKKILLQKRSKTAKRFQDKWGLFGGGVDEGETPEAALWREIKEELDISLKEAKLVGEYQYGLEELQEEGRVFVFIEKYKKEQIDLREGQEMRWVTPKSALMMELHPVYRRVIDDIVRGEISMLS